ncbi:MAG: gliding motility protein GldL [Bacteroidota bacterium]
MGINNIVRGKGYKAFMTKLYGWGASVVIIGALFKINHYPFANQLLIVGLGTESLIFFFSAFEPLHREWDWSLVYPELAGLEEETTKKGKDKNLPVTQQLDKMLAEAKVGPELIESLANGMRNLSENANKLSGVSDAAFATDNYISNLQNATDSVQQLSNAYSKTAEALGKDINSSEEYLMNVQKASSAVGNLASIYDETSRSLKSDGNSYNEQLQKIAGNLTSLNALYELQIQSSNKQIEETSKIQENITKFMGNLNASVENTIKYKDQVEMLTKNVSALNSVYGNMLAAMNVNR